MSKPTTTTMHEIAFVLEGDSKIMILNLEKGGRSYNTKTLPKGTKVVIYASKEPVIE